MIQRCLLALLVTGFSLSVHSAAQCPQDIHALMAHLDMTEQYERIGFEVNHVGEHDKYSRSERYEPLLPAEQRWKLLELDGEMPNKKDQQKFASRRADQGNPLLGFLADIQPINFQLVSQTTSRLHYQFQPDQIEVGSGGKNSLDVSEYVRGSLTLLNDADIGCVLNINLSSPDSFSPRTGVKVKTFSLSNRFLLDDITGLFFPESSTLVLKGRAFLVAGFDVLNRATYSAVKLLPTSGKILDQIAEYHNTDISDGTTYTPGCGTSSDAIQPVTADCQAVSDQF